MWSRIRWWVIGGLLVLLLVYPVGRGLWWWYILDVRPWCYSVWHERSAAVSSGDVVVPDPAETPDPPEPTETHELDVGGSNPVPFITLLKRFLLSSLSGAQFLLEVSQGSRGELVLYVTGEEKGDVVTVKVVIRGIPHRIVDTCK